MTIVMRVTFTFMKVIEIHQINDFINHDAIFFTEEGIIVKQMTQSPLINFLHLTQKLSMDFNTIYLDGHVLIVSCQLSLNAEFKKEFSIYPAKFFLTTTKENIQKQMLRAIHWLTWSDRVQYCSQCGDLLTKIPDLMEKQCRSCSLSCFPNLAPAVIVLVQKNHQILLARSAHFKPGIYSALAGFIDIGESAEEAVYREVQEEVGIKISQLEYFGSQSWPFPNSFMIAFKAHYLSGEISIDPNEIEDAGWFDIDDLPALPSYPSISRKLIDSCSSSILMGMQ